MPALRRFRRSVVVVAVLLLAVQCDNPADLDRPLASIVIVPDSVTLTAIGATRGLEAIARDADGEVIPDLQLLWMTTDPSVAKVTASGLVTAAGNGTADVQAHTANVVGTARVTVSQRAAAIQVDPAGLVLTALGDTARVVAMAQDSLGHGMPGARCVWTSLDSAVVRVDGQGLVTALKVGTAALRASRDGAEGFGVATVIQTAAHIEITVAGDTLYALGDTVALSAVVRDANGYLLAGAAPNWRSLDPSVATVGAEGRVVAAANGRAPIVAAFDEVADTALILVAQRIVAFAIVPDSVWMRSLRDTVRISVVAEDANGFAVPEPARRMVWSSSDSSVVTVDAGGLVEAQANGHAAVVAMTNGLADTAMIAVDQLPAAVTVTPDTLFMWVAHYSVPNPTRDTAWLSAETYDANGYTVESWFILQWRTWTTYLHPVVTVDNGLVTAIGEGTAWAVASAAGAADSAYVHVAMLPPPFLPGPPANRR